MPDFGAELRGKGGEIGTAVPISGIVGGQIEALGAVAEAFGEEWEVGQSQGAAAHGEDWSRAWSVRQMTGLR